MVRCGGISDDSCADGRLFFVYTGLDPGDDPEATYQAVVKDLLQKLDEFNGTGQSEVPLCFAYGHAICTSDQEYSIYDAERLADKEMYKCKHRMKAERVD